MSLGVEKEETDTSLGINAVFEIDGRLRLVRIRG